jgi:hypothetical protein
MVYMIGYYDNPQPNEDTKWIRISESVGDMTLDDLAYDIESYGIRDRVDEIVFKLEIPQPRAIIVEEMVMNIELVKLLKFCGKKTIKTIRESLVDYLYERKKL